jgi:hypothetical protein
MKGSEPASPPGSLNTRRGKHKTEQNFNGRHDDDSLRN